MPIQDFVDTFFAAEGLKNQRRELEMLEHNARVNRTTALANLAKLTTDPEGVQRLGMLAGEPNTAEFLGSLDPSEQTILEDMVWRNAMGMTTEEGAEVDRFAMANALFGTTPSAMVADEFLTEIGTGAVEGLSPETIREIENAWAARTGAGLTPGQLAGDKALASLSPDEHMQIQKIAGGLSLSAEARETVASDAARMRLAWAQFAQESAFEETRLGLTAQDVASRRIAANASAAGAAQGDALGGYTANALRGTMDQILAQLDDTENLSNATLTNMAISYNNAADILARGGLYSSEVRLDTDPNVLRGQDLGPIKQFWQWITEPYEAGRALRGALSGEPAPGTTTPLPSNAPGSTLPGVDLETIVRSLSPDQAEELQRIMGQREGSQ